MDLDWVITYVHHTPEKHINMSIRLKHIIMSITGYKMPTKHWTNIHARQRLEKHTCPPKAGQTYMSTKGWTNTHVKHRLDKHIIMLSTDYTNTYFHQRLDKHICQDGQTHKYVKHRLHKHIFPPKPGQTHMSSWTNT